MPDAGVLATMLLIVGLFLLALELMIPSFGMIGILSAISLLISAWCAWQAWWGTSPGFFWTYAAFWILGIPSVLGGMLYLIQNSRLGDNIVLKGPARQATDDTSVASLIGQTGTASTSLMPGGMVSVNDERFHAESIGVVIEAGSAVEVVRVKGSRLVVRQLTETDQRNAAQNVQQTPSQSTEVPDTLASTEIFDAGGEVEENGALDFQIPEG